MTTNILVDRIIKVHGGDNRATIAYLLGYIRGLENQIGKIQEALGNEKEKTLCEWLESGREFTNEMI